MGSQIAQPKEEVGTKGTMGFPIQVVYDVPASMEEPAEADKAVCVEALVGAIGDDRRENKLPKAQPPIKMALN